MVCYHLVCRIIYDLSFNLLFSYNSLFSKGQVEHQRIIGLNSDYDKKGYSFVGPYFVQTTCKGYQQSRY